MIKVILAVEHYKIEDLRFGKVMSMPIALLHKGQRILVLINGQRERVVVNETDYFEEGVAIIYCRMEDSVYTKPESWDELVSWFQADPNWKQYGIYFETDQHTPDGPTDEEVLALLKS